MIHIKKDESARDILRALYGRNLPNLHEVQVPLPKSIDQKHCHYKEGAHCCAGCIRYSLKECEDCDPCWYVTQFAKKVSL